MSEQDQPQDDEDLSPQEGYRHIDAKIHSADCEVDGKTVSAVIGQYNDGFTFTLIEGWVERVESTDDPAFLEVTDKHGRHRFVPTELAKRMPPEAMRYTLSIFSDRYDYSPALKAFQKAANNAGLLFGCELAGGLFLGDNPAETAELYNRFVSELRVLVTDPDFWREQYYRKAHAKRLYERAVDYVNALFGLYARLLGVRLDLGYHRDHLKDLPVDQIHKDLEHLLNNFRSNKLFKHIVGYIWRIEWTESRGYHAHVYFFFDGSKVRQDAFYGNEIGFYWRDRITGGRGTFWNCNAHKAQYKHLGIGMISHDDPVGRQNVMRAIKYLTKPDQFLRVKSPGRRVFGTGIMPGARKSKAGRPRRIAGA